MNLPDLKFRRQNIQEEKAKRIKEEEEIDRKIDRGRTLELLSLAKLHMKLKSHGYETSVTINKDYKVKVDIWWEENESD